MKINKRGLISLYLLSTFFATSASAEFVIGNYEEENDQRVFLDSNTGLEWLSLVETTNKSINEVIEMIKDNQFPGFRLASENEIIKMIDYFINDELRLSSDKSELFTTLFGLSDYNDMKYSYGLVESVEKNAVVLYGIPNQGTKMYYSHEQGYHFDYKLTAYSVYLVSDSKSTYSAINDIEYGKLISEVPKSVPAPFALTGLSLLGLGFARRK